MTSDSASPVDFRSRINDEDSKLISRLYALTKKSPKLVRSTEYATPADPAIKLRSWKMNEFKYYDIPSPFPTLARGLFTQEVQVDNETKYRIVVRGYDKFFNIGEVPWTSWASLESHTSPPYILTQKSNGCIIFIAALTPTKLVVTSKHAIGTADESGNLAHSQVGHKWLKKHLQDAGKTEEELAKVLWKKNWTAVAELCDDSFEEHVLPYSQEKTGLHLHGLNECSKQFRTMPPNVVDAFASEWGFIQTLSTEVKTIPEVKSFTEEIGRAGKWRGEALEGFVVRTHVSTDPPSKGNPSLSPYEPGSCFFFKVKFDEPYMMYRDWREVTKILLSKGPTMSHVPKSKMRRLETRLYSQWVINEIKRDRKQFDQYTRGRGIISTRERFLKWLQSPDGKKALAGERMGLHSNESASAESNSDKTFGKTIIVPVAIPGVGKTSIAVALVYLFGFGHTQSDDIRAKKPAPIFIKNVTNLLKKHDVVIADKNNHLRQHRQQLRDATVNMRPPVRLMALNWSFDIPQSTIHRICSERVAARGENHQTLRADTSRSYEDVLWMFLNKAEELQEGEVDASIEMDIEEDLESALKRAVDGCVDILGLPRPDAEKMGEALAVARGYSPPTSKKKDEEKKKAPSEPRYFALLPELDLVEVMKKRMNEEDVPPEGKTFWETLLANKRTGDRLPHVTVVHSKSVQGDDSDSKRLWDLCRGLNLLPKSPLFTFKLDHVVWNDRVMAVTISNLAVCSDDDLDPQSDERTKAIEFVIKLPSDVRERLHITVGTQSQDIPPVEAKDLVERWKAGQKEGIGECAFTDLWVKGRVKGLQR